jgi:ABC-type polysaccharide/polyol phosphate export permease
MFMNVQDIAGDDAVSPVATILAPPATILAPPAIKVAQPVGQAANSPYGIIVAEIFAGFGAWRVWTLLGWDDIRQRYRRSVLGPFWITLSMGMFILLLGVIYGRLFHMELATYLPYLAVGIIVWGFMSAATNESCSAFHESGRIIKQIKLPYSVFILRVVWRNFIVFLHNIVIFLPVAIIFHVVPNLNTLYALPGFVLVFVNVTWVAMVLAIISTRYRDIMPIVATVVQILMFATPIMWVVSSLSGAEIIAQINPAYHLIELVRAPMLGTAPEPLSWLVSIAMALAGSVLATALLVRKSRRIVFWL